MTKFINNTYNHFILEAKADQMFPDEVDTPNDMPARIRFQKYRGLQSFRTSPWDVKENLPAEYARIFQFENFDRTRKRVFKNLENITGAMVNIILWIFMFLIRIINLKNYL